MVRKTYLFVILFFVGTHCPVVSGQSNIESGDTFFSVFTKIKDERLENLSKAVAELRVSYDERDLLRITGLFNSQDIENVGGHERFTDFVWLGGSASPRTLAKFGSSESILSEAGNGSASSLSVWKRV